MAVLPFALRGADELRVTNGNTAIRIPKKIPPRIRGTPSLRTLQNVGRLNREIGEDEIGTGSSDP